jgi:hypothetical protein
MALMKVTNVATHVDLGLNLAKNSVFGDEDPPALKDEDLPTACICALFFPLVLTSLFPHSQQSKTFLDTNKHHQFEGLHQASDFRQSSFDNRHTSTALQV